MKFGFNFQHYRKKEGDVMQGVKVFALDLADPLQSLALNMVPCAQSLNSAGCGTPKAATAFSPSPKRQHVVGIVK